MTWFIEKNNISKIRDSFTSSFPYYLVEFTNTYTCTTFTAIFQDKRNCAPVQLEIDEVCSSAVDPSIGKINFNYTGEWNANIYAQNSSTNLDFNLADEFVASRELLVYLKGCDTCTKC